MRPELKPFARRLLPAREDLAAEALAGTVAAARFVRGTHLRVTAPLLDLALSPDPGAGLATQLLHGEPFTVYETREDGLAWGQSGWDGYVGYVAAAGLGPAVEGAAPRRITAIASHVYSRPDIKAPVRAALPWLAAVEAAGESGNFLALAGGGFVPRAHLAPGAGDFIAEARRLAGTPYLWGGRSAAGIDCSGLVQLALMAAGHVDVPRDSDMQAALLGAAHDPGAAPEPGDLLFWKGHVGIVSGADLLLHANAHHMAVAEEPLGAAIARIAASGGGPVTGRRRPPARPDPA
ncbi:MAG: C40 family peptidase [Rhodobacteraceae bacterium]|nr:C40 family peptidase [Paracoccaceae bacterium]